MNNEKTINFYEALRQMEQMTEPFSVSWCKFSESTEKGGEIKTVNKVLFEGKRETENYELIFFKSPTEQQLICCHLYSLMYFNNLKMIIE